MELQQLLDKASSFHEAGQQSEALRYYNQAFEKLTNEAALYAHTQPYTVKRWKDGGWREDQNCYAEIFWSDEGVFKKW